MNESCLSYVGHKSTRSQTIVLCLFPENGHSRGCPQPSLVQELRPESQGLPVPSHSAPPRETSAGSQTWSLGTRCGGVGALQASGTLAADSPVTGFGKQLSPSLKAAGTGRGDTSHSEIGPERSQLLGSRQPSWVGACSCSHVRLGEE